LLSAFVSNQRRSVAARSPWSGNAYPRGSPSASTCWPILGRAVSRRRCRKDLGLGHPLVYYFVHPSSSARPLLSPSFHSYPGAGCGIVVAFSARRVRSVRVTIRHYLAPILIVLGQDRLIRG